MKKTLELPLQLQRMENNLKGVFLREDLANLFVTPLAITLSKRIDVLIENGFLSRAMRGVYYTPGASLLNLAQRIFPDGYISLETALSINGLIGTRSLNRVDIITTHARPKSILTGLGTIHMKIIDTTYFSGFTRQGGVNIACAEKALIDTCYFHFHKTKYNFSLSTDINIIGLDMGLISQILSKYKNQKFVSFTKGLLLDYGCII